MDELNAIGGAFLVEYGTGAPTIAGVELAEGEVQTHLVLVLRVLVLTGGQAGGVGEVSRRIDIDLALFNSAELVVGCIRAERVLLELAVVIVCPVADVNLNAGEVHLLRTALGVGVGADSTDEHTGVTVLIVLIVTAYVVVNVDDSANLTVGHINGSISVYAAENTAAANVPGSPKCRDLVGVVYLYVGEVDHAGVSVGCESIAYNTAVGHVVCSGVGVGNSDVLKVRVTRCVSRNTARGGELSVGLEVVNGKILHRTVVNVAEQTHTVVVVQIGGEVVVGVVALDVPGALKNVGDGLAVTVEGTVEGVNGTVDVSGILSGSAVTVLVVGEVVADRKPESAHETAEVEMFAEHDGLACEIVLCDALCHAAYDSAKACELLLGSDGEGGVGGVVPACVNSAVPGVLNSDNCGDLGEAGKTNGNCAGGGVVYELVVRGECLHGLHLNGSAVLNVVENYRRALETCGHYNAEVDEHGHGVAVCKALNVYVKAARSLALVYFNVAGTLNALYGEHKLGCAVLHGSACGNNCRHLACGIADSHFLGELIACVQLAGYVYGEGTVAVILGELCICVIIRSEGVGLAHVLCRNKVYTELDPCGLCILSAVCLVAYALGHIHNERKVVGCGLGSKALFLLIALVERKGITYRAARILAGAVGGGYVIDYAELYVVRERELLAVCVNGGYLAHDVNAESVLERQAACVGHAEIYDLGVAGLPESILVKELCALVYGVPLSVCVILELNVKVTGCDNVVFAHNRVGEPCECGADKHSGAQTQGNNAEQERSSCFGSHFLILIQS